MLLQSASSSGGIKSIQIKITADNFSYGHPESKLLHNTSLRDINRVSPGLAPHMVSLFTEDVSLRAFHITLKSNTTAASFVTPSMKHRDAIIKGLSATLNVFGDKATSSRISSGKGDSSLA